MIIDQLIEFNLYICQRIDELQVQEALQNIIQLRIGAKLMFGGNQGPVVGVPIKINRKSVIMVGDGMQQLKISLSLFRPLEDVK